MEHSERYNRALEFATKAHCGSYRKGTNVPYIDHPIDVANIVEGMTSNEDIVIAALLHDVIEDTSYTKEDITQLFGEHVAELVASESEDKRRDLPAESTWRIRKEESIAHLRNASREAKIIALADKLSNMRNTLKAFSIKGKDMWLVFNEKDHDTQGWYYNSVAEALSELDYTPEWQEYRTLCDKIFQKN